MSVNKGQTAPSKRVCMVVLAYYPLAETRVQREAEALLANGYGVDVISLKLPHEPSYEVVRGVHVHRLPMGRRIQRNFTTLLAEYLRFLALATLKLARLYRKAHYQVIQVHNLPDFLVFSALWPKLHGAKVILDIHDVMPEFFAARTDRPMHSRPVRLVVKQEQWSCRFADHVITVTDLWRQALIQRGVPPEKVSVVMNVADARIFHRSVRRQHPNRPSDGLFRLFYHGTQAHRYGLDILLQAVAQIRSEIPPMRVILHGTGEVHEKLVRLAQELEIADIVEFNTQFVPLTELPLRIIQADVGVVPYRRDLFTDGILPTKLMEYIALGLPVIASRTPAIAAYLDEDMVHLVNPEDVDDLATGILKLYRDKAYRDALVVASERFLRRYSWEDQQDRYVKLMNRLCNG